MDDDEVKLAAHYHEVICNSLPGRLETVPMLACLSTIILSIVHQNEDHDAAFDSVIKNINLLHSSYKMMKETKDA